MTDAYRGLGWEHGSLVVQRLGAMLAPVTFLLPGGRQVVPFQVAPWAGDDGADALPGILRRLRGEWPCVPFGYTVPADGFPADWSACFAPADPGEEIHGASSNRDWRWEDCSPEVLRLSLDYPEDSPVRRVERTVTPDPKAPAIDVELRVEVRRDCRLPIGLHPTLRLPVAGDRAWLELGRFAHGRTYPTVFEPAAPLFAENARFSSLAAVPARDGRSIDATRLPLADETDELRQLNGIDGTAALANEAEGYRFRLTWQREHFPSLLLWLSNRGRKMFPWNGRHVAVGIEPICSPFGLGPGTALADNPIARSGTPTALAFRAGQPFVTRYRIAAEPL